MLNKRLRALIALVALIGLPLLAAELVRRPAQAQKAGPPADARQVFERRIMPIFKSPEPSSCVQCHLAAVDLKNYILPSSEKTFLSLRDQGLVDLARPEASKILRLIKMGESDKGASLIQQKTRQAEYEAFAEWIKACCADPKLRAAAKLKPDELAKPTRPNEVIRHARKDRLLESFERNLWAMRFRCMSCHIEGTAENAKLRKEHGERVSWFKAGGPEATLNYLMTSKLIDAKQPEQSLLLLKPLGTVKHGGGIKVLVGDQGYKAIRGFLEDYARIANDQYASAADLPREQTQLDQFGSEIWLKLTNTPSAWGNKLAQVTIYPWNAPKRTWDTTPIATSDRKVWGKGKLWQHTLTLMAPRNSPQAKAWKQQAKPTLPQGKYLVKVHVDLDDRLARDWKAVLGARDYVGQVEVSSRWPEGYGSMTAVDASQVKR